MKGMLLIMLFAIAVPPAKGEIPQFNLARYNIDFNRIQRTGMIVLGSWAVTNFAGNGLPYLFMAEEPLSGEVRNFMLMNIGWNLINAALAGAGYFSCCIEKPGEISLAKTVKRQYVAEKTFLFNAGLDFGYMAFGLFLTELAESNANAEMLTGFGYSLITQGAALFVFDVTMQVIHARHRRKLDSYLAGF